MYESRGTHWAYRRSSAERLTGQKILNSFNTASLNPAGSMPLVEKPSTEKVTNDYALVLVDDITQWVCLTNDLVGKAEVVGEAT